MTPKQAWETIINQLDDILNKVFVYLILFGLIRVREFNIIGL